MEIVGRDADLAAVAWLIHAATDGAAALTFRGEAGIGKTVLWEEAVRLARQRGLRVLACRPSQSETELSFSALSDLLVDLDEEALGSLPQPQRSGIEVALLRRDPAGESVDWRATAAGVLSILGDTAEHERRGHEDEGVSQDAADGGQDTGGD